MKMSDFMWLVAFLFLVGCEITFLASILHLLSKQLDSGLFILTCIGAGSLYRYKFTYLFSKIR